MAQRSVLDACPACGASSFEEMPFTSDQELGSFEILVCRACSHKFLREPPTDAELADFYDRYYANDERRDQPGRPGFRDRALVRRLAPRLRKGARVLDVGANFGATLLAFPKHCELEGIELSTPAAQAANRSPRLNIHNAAFDELELPAASYDCIVALAVIEHVPNSQAFVAKIAKLLAPGGVAVLMTGDSSSWRARDLGRDWPLYHSGGHLHFFTSLSLESALQREGLAVRERVWAGPNPLSSRLPAKLGRAIHCQTTSLTLPHAFGHRPLGDLIYVWAEHREFGGRA